MKLFKEYLLLFITIVLIFIICEAGIRICIYINSQKNFGEVIKKVHKPEPGAYVPLRQIIQPSKYRKIIYELIPNLRVYFLDPNILLETNDNGWRSRSRPINKDKNCVRIIGIGDSFMFGQGVNQKESYLSILEEELNSRFPQKKWELINTAVPGYNTVMEVETLEKKALIYKPDIVILEFIGNDLCLPNFIYEANDYLNLKKSFFAEFILKRLKLIKEEYRLFNAPKSQNAQKRSWDFFEDAPQFVPPRYKDMVGWEPFYKAMLKLKKIQEINNFDVVFIISFLGYDKAFNLGKELKFYTAYNNATHNTADQSNFLSNKDFHFSRLGHKRTAEFIINFMEQNKIIDKYFGR